MNTRILEKTVVPITIERGVLIVIWLVSIISIILFIPKQKRRMAALAFLMCQVQTWIITMLHVKYALLAFPVREFPKATDLLFTSEYFFYPLICAFYVIYEPKQKGLIRLAHLALSVSVLTVIDVLLETYTRLLTYVHYAWYWTWLSFFVEFYIVRLYCRWFFKDQTKVQADRMIVQ